MLLLHQNNLNLMMHHLIYATNKPALPKFFDLHFFVEML